MLKVRVTHINNFKAIAKTYMDEYTIREAVTDAYRVYRLSVVEAKIRRLNGKREKLLEDLQTQLDVLKLRKEMSEKL